MNTNLNVFLLSLLIVLAHPERAAIEGSYAFENNLFHTFQWYMKLYSLL